MRTDETFPVKVVSGGQTGVDRAALKAALELGLEVGGWCPRGRRAEDGPIAARFPLVETPLRSYRQRTEWNVRDSDATLILHGGTVSGGTRLTAELARRYGRPLMILDLAAATDLEVPLGWLRAHRIRVLNLAGPRESGTPGIEAQAAAFLMRLLTLIPASSGRQGARRKRG